jgi:D-lactate dehydrogenase
MNIVCFEIEDWESNTLRGLCHGQDVVMVQKKIDVHNADDYEAAEIISCFIYSDLRRPVLEKLKNLKMIATRSTGTDHIDLDYCRSRGIAVANVPAYGEHTVAEHVFALLLALSRHIPQAVRRTRDGDFSFSGLCGFDLYGKTLGLIGTGAIGLHVARIAKGFGMKVLGYDVNPCTDAVLTSVGFDTLLSVSDIISLHVPGTPQTHHMLSQKEFAMMKDGVVIINTARGQVIDVRALLRALQSGKVSAAGLDVLPEEPTIREEAELLRESFAQQHDLEALLADYALLHHKNVIVTPHSAFYTNEAVEKIIQTTGDSILSFVAGEPKNIVGSFQPVKEKAL